MNERNPVFAECSRCGEVWKVATLPMLIRQVVKAFKHAICPNCGATGKSVFICDAVKAKDGVIDWEKKS